MPNIPNRQWRLISRPQTNLTEANFEFGTQPVDDLVAGEVLVKNELISLDPSSRVRSRSSSIPTWWWKQRTRWNAVLGRARLQ